MFSSADKTRNVQVQRQQQQPGQTFFRKAGEESFFGAKESPSFFSSTIQAKLSVSSPDDPQEKEADAVADQVMRMPEPVAMSEKKEEEQIQKKVDPSSESLAKEEDKDEKVQAKSESPFISVQRKCESCEQEDKAQAKLFRMIQRSEDASSSSTDFACAASGSDYHIDRKEISIHHSDVIQRSGRGPPANSIHGSFEHNLSSSKGAGNALPSDTRQFMESRFSANFSGVRIHTGSYAENLSSNIHAQAFTHGNDIYFNSGKYAPNTSAGGTLLAHELTHTIQQGASTSHTPTTVATKSVARKNIIQRSAAAVPSQLTNAVDKAKTVEGKIDANKPQADGNRTGWEHLVEIFKSTFGEEMIVSGGGSAAKGAVAEQDIKKKREQSGVMVVDTTSRTDRSGMMGTKTGTRDAMPSWCGIFVFWALNKSGVPMPKWKLGERMIKPEAARSPGTTPLPGDIAYRNAFSHFAIVANVNGATVTTVNGNTAGEDNLGGQVQTKDHPLSDWTAFFDPLKIKTGALGDGEGAAVQEPPKTLAELRNDAALLNRKEEAAEENETAVQTKQELSSWQVNAKGGLQTTTPAIQKAEENKELQKKDEEQKEEEKINAGPVNSVQKKEVDEFASGEASCTENNCSHSSQHTIQTKTENQNSSLTAQKDVPVQDMETEQERGPPVQMKSEEEDVVQRSVIDDALSHTSLSQLASCLGFDTNEMSVCLLRKASQIAMYIPGYKALRVVLGRDPITHEDVERNGHNLLDAAFDIMPFGNLIQQKLNEEGLLDQAAEWIDGKIAGLESIVNDLFSEFDQFWNDIEFSLDMSPMGVLRDGSNIVLRFINNIISFAEDAAEEIVEMIKEALLNAIVDFIKENTTAYPLLTVVLGEDPVTKQKVDRNGTNILNALLELGGEEGIQQRTQMQETGTFQKVVGYIDEGITVFGNLYDTIVQNFSNIWDMVTISALMNPVETFRSIYNIFAEPVAKVLDFVIRVGKEILKLIKEVLMQRLSAWARQQRGYALVTVIIGKDPFTDEVVPFTMENVIKGFFSLMEGGEEQYNQLKESGAIDRTVAKITAAVNRLNMTPAAIVQLFIDLWNSFSISDLMDPIGCFMRIIERFGEPIGRLIVFVIEIVKIVIEAILIVMNFPFDLINNIITRAMAAFESIKRDPVAFLKNLLRAIKQGFIQFFDNILQHLIQGLVGWLMSELRDAGVPELTDLSLRGVIAWVLEVLGISMEKIWEKLAAHPRIGPQRVARIRSMINTLEGIWTFIRDVQERGMAAIWDKIQEQLSNLWNTILDAVKNWVMEQIINRIVTRLLSMLDPTGIMAVVNSVIAIYNAIQSFIKYLREMLEVINSFVNGVAEIAEGNITTAANYLERTMARAMPVVIGFLANQVGLSGIGRRVGEMIERAREMVDEALTWLVNRAVDTGMSLIDRVMAMGASARDAVLGWLGLRKQFTSDGGNNHAMYFRGSGANTALIIESTPVNVDVFLTDKRNEINTSTMTDEQKATLLGKITLAQQKKAEIQQLVYPADRNAAPPANQESLVNTKMDELVNLIKQIDVGGNNQVIPPATITPGFSNTKATHLEVRYLHKGPGNHRRGTPASNYRGDLSGARTALRTLGLSSRWVAFHVLNENLGGLAVDSNLVPTPMYINNEYKDRFENEMKTRHDTVNASGQSDVLWMTALFEYRSAPLNMFLASIAVQGGSMKFENGSWVEDNARVIPMFAAQIDSPNTETFAINEILNNESEWMLVTNLSSVTYRTLEILKNHRPSGGYSSLPQMDAAIDGNIGSYGFSNPARSAQTLKQSLRSITIVF